MKNVFLAEDDEDDRLFFEEALKEVSFDTELTLAHDGEQLMATLDKLVTDPPPPDVIFIDLNMPRKNGYECLKEIRETPKYKNIPVVIFSTTANEYAIETTYSLGANCYVRKPNTHQLLIKSIEAVLSLDLWTMKKQLPKEEFVLAIS